ncbi:MAG: linalool dehydratase/isomerase domain-containing protein [Planctomycetota bacterium]|jgi:hypothetical protein
MALSAATRAALRRAFDGEGLPRLKRVPLTLAAVLLGAAVWLPLVHLFHRPDVSDFYSEADMAPKARMLAERHLTLWTDEKLRSEVVGQMRGSNAEWDFMGRTFVVLALANMSLREPAWRDRCLKAMDRIIEETLEREKKYGLYYFLMPYARNHAWINQPPRSLFIDGEIALMIGARQTIAEREDFKAPLAERVDTMIGYMRRSPVLSGESYPDECWTFCNCMALAAIRVSDTLDGRDHSAFIEEWLASAKRQLIDRRGNTGIIVSEYTLGGLHMDGPEGSTVWTVVHCLSLVDEEFARDQHRRARKELYRKTLGFGYCREWPESCVGPADVDSGPIVPFIEASAGSSGTAFLGAATFRDEEMLAGLLTSLDFGAFPVEEDGTLRYCASNQVGDAVMLYSMTMGPLWKKVAERWTARSRGAKP